MRRCLVILLILALTAGVILLAGCGGNGESATSPDSEGTQESSGGPVSAAEQAACAANRKTISSAIQQYKAIEGKAASSIQQLVPKYLQHVPTCPAGGTYSIQGSTVTCSVHGS